MTETIARATLVRRAAVGGAALVAGGAAIAVLPRRAGSAPSAAQDTTVLALALTLEQAQLALYTETAKAAAVGDELLAFVTAAAAHETVHVETIQTMLGATAGDAPAFDFGTATTDAAAFGKLAIRLENIAIQSFNGQIANLTPAARAELARIVSVDARHAGWMRGIVGERPAGQAVDAGASAAETQAALTSIGILPGGTP